MQLRILPTLSLLILIILGWSFQAQAQGQSALGSMYVQLSKKSYEWVNGKCPALYATELLGSKLCQKAKISNVEDLEATSEALVFSALASEQEDRLQCASDKLKTILKDESFVQTLKADYIQKVMAAKAIYQDLLPAREELIRERAKVNTLLVSALNSPGAMNQYESAREALSRKEKSVTQMEAALNSVLSSSWMGDFKSVKGPLLAMVQDRSLDQGSLRLKLNQDFGSLMSNAQAEISEGQKKLSKQKQATSPPHWNLDTATKTQLFRSSQENNSVAKLFVDSPELGQSIQCQLEGKYGKGQDYLDNTIFAGTLLASGGAAIAARVALATRGAAAMGVNVGKISEQGARVLISSATVGNATQILQSVERECLKGNQLILKNAACGGDPKKISQMEIAKLEEGNCALAIVLSGAPLPAIVAARIALKEIKLTELQQSLARKGENRFTNQTSFYSQKFEVTAKDVMAREAETRKILASQGAKFEVATPRLVKNPKIEGHKKQLELVEARIQNARSGEEGKLPQVRAEMNQAITEAEQRVNEAQQKLATLKRQSGPEHLEFQEKKKKLELENQEKLQRLKSEFEDKISNLKSDREKRIRELKDQLSDLQSQGASGAKTESLKNRIAFEENYLKEEIEKRAQTLEKNMTNARERLAQRLADAEADLDKALARKYKTAASEVQTATRDLEETKALQTEHYEKIQDEYISKLERDRSRLTRKLEEMPDKVDEDMVSNLEFGLYSKQLAFKSESEKLKRPVELYKVTGYPAQKGPRRFDTETIRHPDFQKEVEDLKALGVEVRIDPSLSMDTTAAFNFDGTKVVHIRADSPWHYFKHEAQHAKYSNIVKPKLADVELAGKEGKSIQSLFTEKEIQVFGGKNMNRLDELVQKQNTSLASDETLAVEEQLKAMGFVKIGTREAVRTEAYAVWHQINGYKEILKEQAKVAQSERIERLVDSKNKSIALKDMPQVGTQALNPVQQKEYEAAVKRFALMHSYLDGTKEAQKVIRNLQRPSEQALISMSQQLEKTLSREIEPRPILADKEGRILFQRQDGVWERLDLQKKKQSEKK